MMGFVEGKGQQVQMTLDLTAQGRAVIQFREAGFIVSVLIYCITYLTCILKQKVSLQGDSYMCFSSQHLRYGVSCRCVRRRHVPFDGATAKHLSCSQYFKIVENC